MINYLEKNRTISVTITILIAIEIFYLSSLSLLPENPVKEIINLATAHHIMVFFLLAFFLMAAIKGKNKIKTKHFITVIIIALIYAISDEIHQIFVPGRFPSIKDILFDLMGILFAVLVYPKREK